MNINTKKNFEVFFLRPKVNVLPILPLNRLW